MQNEPDGHCGGITIRGSDEQYPGWPAFGSCVRDDVGLNKPNQAMDNFPGFFVIFTQNYLRNKSYNVMF